MSVDDNHTVEGTTLQESALLAELRQLYQELELLREQLSHSNLTKSAGAPNAAVARLKDLKIQVTDAAASAQLKADDIERQLRIAVRDKPVTVIAISVSIGYFLALLTWPYARRKS